MPREPARNKKPRKEPTNFVARFRFSWQISNRATFFLSKHDSPTYFMPPNRLFRHFRASTGVCDVARFQKTAEKWNRATFTGHRTCQSGRRHATMARKTRPRLHPFHLFDVPALPYQEQEPRIPKTSAFRSKQFPSRYEKGDIAKASTHKQKTSKATSQIYDVARLKNTSKHPFLLSRRNQQRLKHNEPTHRLLLGVARRLPPQLNLGI